MTTTAEAPATGMQCQREAARYATTIETAAQRNSRIRRNAIADAVATLGRGDHGRAAYELMLDALHLQAPLTFRPAVAA